MALEDKHISYRIYLVAFAIFFVAIAIAVKLTNIQWVEGDYYRKLAKDRTVKTFVIPANKGNIYSADGSLLATSIPRMMARIPPPPWLRKALTSSCRWPARLVWAQPPIARPARNA